MPDTKFNTKFKLHQIPSCYTAGVLFGEGLIAVIPQNILKKVAALAFIAIGVWMFFSK